MHRSIRLAGVLVLILVLANVASLQARPPVRFEELTKRLVHVASFEDGAERLQEEIKPELDALLPFLPKGQSEVVRSAVALVESGRGDQAAAALARMPRWPEVSLQTLGAARLVPGSCHLLRTPDANVLVDCGMDQGPRERAEAFNRRRFSFDPREIDLLIVTHAHIDHTGLIPRLVKEGFEGQILCTRTTGELLKVLLEDSAGLQRQEALRRLGFVGKKGKKEAKKKENQARIEAELLYSKDDVVRTLKLVDGLDYDCEWKGLPGLRVRLRDAGHLPGSAAAEVWVRHSTGESKIVFGGDTGNSPYPLMRDPQPIDGADVLVLESTYGNRLHEAVDMETRYRTFKKHITEAIADGGITLVPCFAVGRAQTLLFWIGRMKKDGTLPGKVPVVLDSPMAIETLEIMRRHPECMDGGESEVGYGDKRVFLDFPNLILGLPRGEPVPPNAIVIASSGMLTGGKIMQHVRSHVDRDTTDILFSGYQAEGTLGREILEGAEKVKMWGQWVPVRAKAAKLAGMSGHADQRMLLKWVESFSKRPEWIVVVHGDPEAGSKLSELIEAELEIPTLWPVLGEVMEIVK